MTAQYRRDLGVVSDLIADRVARVAGTVELADVDGWWEGAVPQVERLVRVGNNVSGALAGRYLRTHAATDGARVAVTRAPVARARLTNSLEVTGPVAFKTHVGISGDALAARAVMIRRLRGSAVRLVLAGARDTTTVTAEASPQVVGWRRVSATSPCAFCAMLISRGAVYKEATALGSPAFHDHDRCTYEPLYERESEPAEVETIRRQFRDSTEGLSGRDAVRAFRREWDAGRAA